MSTRGHSLIRDCFGAISLALGWVVTKFSKKADRFHYYCDDVTGTSFALSRMLDTFRENYDMLNSTLWRYHKQNPLESVDEFVGSFEDGLQFEIYIENFLDILLKPLPPVAKLNRDFEKVVWGCHHCRHRFECLYVLKEFLSYLDPHSNTAQASVNHRIFRNSRDKIARILEKYLIQSNDGAGWAFNTKDQTIDPYVTARLLEFFFDWNDRIEEFRFKEDFSKDSDVFNKCLETLKNIQVKEDSTEKYNMLDEINIKGSWREIQWGDFEVWRVKGASHIAEILYKIEGKKSREIEEAKSFIQRACGDNLYAPDAAVFSDCYTATVSDITGAIGAVDFYVALGEEFGINTRSDPILSRIKWLLGEQRKDGSWPVLSKEFWIQASQEKPEILRRRISTEEKMNDNNISMCNTMLMLATLIRFLKKSL